MGISIARRLLKRAVHGPYWVMPGGFRKASYVKKKDSRNANLLTVYRTGEDLQYVLDTYNQININEIFPQYDQAFFHAFATPELVGALLELFDVIDTDYDESEMPSDAIRRFHAEAKRLVEERIAMLERDYMEPENEIIGKRVKITGTPSDDGTSLHIEKIEPED